MKLKIPYTQVQATKQISKKYSSLALKSLEEHRVVPVKDQTTLIKESRILRKEKFASTKSINMKLDEKMVGNHLNLNQGGNANSVAVAFKSRHKHKLENGINNFYSSSASNGIHSAVSVISIYLDGRRAGETYNFYILLSLQNIINKYRFVDEITYIRLFSAALELLIADSKHLLHLCQLYTRNKNAIKEKDIQFISLHFIILRSKLLLGILPHSNRRVRHFTSCQAITMAKEFISMFPPVTVEYDTGISTSEGDYAQRLSFFHERIFLCILDVMLKNERVVATFKWICNLPTYELEDAEKKPFKFSFLWTTRIMHYFLNILRKDNEELIQPFLEKARTSYHLDYSSCIIENAKKLIDGDKSKGINEVGEIIASILKSGLDKVAIEKRGHSKSNYQIECLNIAENVVKNLKERSMRIPLAAYHAFLFYHQLFHEYERVVEIFEKHPEHYDRNSFTMYLKALMALERGAYSLLQLKAYLAKPGRNLDEALVLTCMTGLQKFDRSKYNFEARRLYQKYIFEGNQPSGAILNSMMQILCKEGDMGSASKVWDELIARGLTPDSKSYCIFISGYAKSGDYMAAQTVFNEMKKAGIPQNAIAYNYLISAYIKCDELEKALSVYFKMIQNNIIPTYGSSCILINIYSLMGREQSMIHSLEMHKRKYVLSGYAIGPVIRYYALKSNYNLAFKFARMVLVHPNIRPSEKVYIHGAVLYYLMSNPMIRERVIRVYMAKLKEKNIGSEFISRSYMRYLFGKKLYHRLCIFEKSLTIRPAQDMALLALKAKFLNGKLLQCEQGMKQYISDGMVQTLEYLELGAQLEIAKEKAKERAIAKSRNFKKIKNQTVRRGTKPKSIVFVEQKPKLPGKKSARDAIITEHILNLFTDNAKT